MIKILKASAGSGKTFHLALEYIFLLLQSREKDAYRHILAVTFTNKATEEMKRRILDELYQLSRDPQHSRYLKPLTEMLGKTPEEISGKARAALSAILNDYSSFAVSTIDKFFQQALRAFSREIGQFASYQVQLDRDALVAEGVDRVLDSLTEEGDPELLKWLGDSARESLEQKGYFSLDGGLTELAKSLNELSPDTSFSRGSLKQLRAVCVQLRKDYLERVKKAAKEVLDTLSSSGVAPEDTNSGFLKAIYKYGGDAREVPAPTEAFVRKAQDPEAWFAKKNAHLKDALDGKLQGPLQAFLDCFGQPYKEYNTARIIQDQLYSLGVAAELREALVAVQKDNNQLSLDDSNAILKGIIDGTDAPFIYEKLGVRFDHFLLDEFQDTADIQWENFQPLLKNALSGGNKSLVVGDVKQSIYRWRGSDWQLLDSRLEEEFPDAVVRPLENNWRTCREIVAFNNEFFPFAAGQLDALLETDVISRLYKDVQQNARFPDPAPGSVEVSFVEDQLQEIVQTLRDLRERGGKWQDAAILVRSNKEGTAIAAHLLENGIPVMSDESLLVKSSVTVRRLVGRLEQPERQGGLEGGYHSLPDLCEALLRQLREEDPDAFNAEIPYIQSFMDYLQDWVSAGGGLRLDAFLKDWKNASPKIASPQLGDSVRVITIHKAKGLEFPFVIVPFVESITLYKFPVRWCKPAVEGTALEGEAPGPYRVNLVKETANSLFENDYREECLLQAVDNLNLLYVALTRARYGLKIIGNPPGEKLSNMRALLSLFIEGDSYFRGEYYPMGSLPAPEENATAVEAAFPSFLAQSGARLKVSEEAADYFGADGSVGAAASRRIRGSVLHGILSRVNTPEDLPAAVEAAVGAGELPEAEKSASLSFLQERLQGVEDRRWFSPQVKVLCEAAIIGPDGNEYRPDRVVLHPDGSVDVIDYKFGKEEARYRYQVLRYMQLYRKMGYEKVAGYLWYLEDNLITFVS